MIINVAVAISGSGGIGLKGGLPWPHLKADMALFSKRTTGAGRNAVLMGKNTWYSIPENRRPLKNRTNIVISRNQVELNNCHVFSSICDAVAQCEKCGEYDEVWIIGGSGIYNEVLNVHYDKVNRVYITYVFTNSDGEKYECDTFINIPNESYLIEEKTYNSTEKCYYLTCIHIHKAHLGERTGLELLEDFIDGCHRERDSNNNNLRIDS